MTDAHSTEYVCFCCSGRYCQNEALDRPPVPYVPPSNEHSDGDVSA